MKILIGLLAFVLAAVPARADDETFENGFSPVDPVSIEVAEKRGKEIYERDQYAWKATDLLFKKGFIKGEHGVTGWVTERLGKKKAVTYFLKGTSETPELAFAVKFKSLKRKPKIDKSGKLSATVLSRFRARQRALKEIDFKCGQTYNSVVLDDGDDYLVYWLAATTDPGKVYTFGKHVLRSPEIIDGGHFRIRIDKATLAVTKKERLSHKCRDIVAYRAVIGKMLTTVETRHRVTDGPLETHAFLSRQHSALYIRTRSGTYEAIDGKFKLMASD